MMSAMVPMITAVMPTAAPVLMVASVLMVTSVLRVVSAGIQITSTSIYWSGQELADCMTEKTINKSHNKQ